MGMDASLPTGASVRTAANDDNSAAGGGILSPQQLGLDYWGGAKWIFAQKTQLNAFQWAAETSRGETEDFNAADGDWINDVATSGTGSVAIPEPTAGSVMRLWGPTAGNAGYARWFPGAGAGVGGGAPILAKFTGSIQTGEGATFGYLADPGEGTALVELTESSPQLYPTAARTFATMRVTAPGGGLLVDCQVTLYKNGAPTAQTITIPAGAPAGTVTVDAAHPIAFAANDKFDVRWDINGGADFFPVSVTLEGVSAGTGVTSIADQLWNLRQRRFQAMYRIAVKGGAANGNPFVAGMASISGGAPVNKVGLGSPQLVANANWHVTLNDVSVFDTGIALQAGATGRNYFLNLLVACYDFNNLVVNLRPGVGADQVAMSMAAFNALFSDSTARPYAGIESGGGNIAQQGVFIDKAIFIKEI